MATATSRESASADGKGMAHKAIEAGVTGYHFARPLLVAAGVASIAHGIGEGNKVDTSRADAATAEITSDIALDHQVGVIQGGTAVVTLDNGSKVRISNPIVSREGGVAERTRGSDDGELSTVTTYAEGDDNVKDIAYFEQPNAPKIAGEKRLAKDGSSSPEVAASVAATNGMQIERANGLSGGGDPGELPENNYFEPASDSVMTPHGPDKKIAQGTEYAPGQQLNEG